MTSRSPTSVMNDGAARSASELRAEFDRAFSLPPEQADADATDFLRVRVGNATYAISLADIASVQRTLAVVSLPSSAPSLTGLAVIDDRVICVFALSALLAVEGAEACEAFIIVDGGELALAASQFCGHVRLPRTSVRTSVAAGLSHVRGAILVDDAWDPILDVESLLAAVAVDDGRERTKRGG